MASQLLDCDDFGRFLATPKPQTSREALDISTLSLRSLPDDRHVVCDDGITDLRHKDSLFDSPSRSSPGSQGSKNFKVVVRVRPLIDRERLAECSSCVTIDSRTVITLFRSQDFTDMPGATCAPSFSSGSSAFAAAGQKHTFMFDRVYEPAVCQRELYESAVEPVVDSILKGYNGSIICYGQTGSGKTFTVEGGQDEESKGVIPRTSHHIFHHIASATDKHSRFLVRVSFLQIYNEKVMDLLDPNAAKRAKQPGADNRKSVRIRQGARGNISIEGLSEHVVRTPEDIADLLARGGAMRTTAATKMNRASSRSHAVFSIIVERAETHGASSTVTIGKLNLVDLAGSERIKTSGAEGKRLEETKSINSSLSAFGKVILALTSPGQSHIPYRDSKLTQLLQDSLGGNCKTTLITNISPSSNSLSESVLSLNFANRAKRVKNHAMVNQDMSEQALLSKYEKEIKRLQRQLQEQQHLPGEGFVDRSELERVESQWAKISQEKAEIVSELEKRSEEVERYAVEKQCLEERILDLESRLVTGGTHATPGQAPVRVEDTEEFQHAIRKKEKELHKEYVEKMHEVEQQRQELAKAKEELIKQQEEIAREREQLRPATSSSVVDVMMNGEAPYDNGARAWAARHTVQNAWVDERAASESQHAARTLDDYVRALIHPDTGIPQYLHTAHGACFTGLHAAKWFMENMEGVDTLEMAMEIGQKFLDLDVISHVHNLPTFNATEAHLFVFTAGAQQVLSRSASIHPSYYQPSAHSPSPAVPEQPYTRPSSEQLYTRPSSSASILTTDGYPSPGLSDSPECLLEEDLGSNALHAAAAKGDKSAVKSLIPAYGIDSTDQCGRTPLMYAAISNRSRICEFLLRSGATVRAVDNNGRTPLICAAHYGHVESMRVLLSQRASPPLVNAVDTAGRTALHWSVKSTNVAALQLLAKHCPPEVVMARDNEATTALHWAVLCKRPQHLQILLKTLNADPTVGDSEGRTCLHYAVSTKALDCAKIIIDYAPAAINQRESRGRTALHLAVTTDGSLDMVELLMSCENCDINCTDTRKTTPLHWAAVSNKQDVARTLLQQGAKVMVRDSYNMTPLHYAIQKGHRDMASILQRYAGKAAAGRTSQKSPPPPVDNPQLSHSAKVSTSNMRSSSPLKLTASSQQLLAKPPTQASEGSSPSRLGRRRSLMGPSYGRKDSPPASASNGGSRLYM